jgi:hypothetical protein
LPFGAPPPAPWKRQTVQPRTAGALHRSRVRFEVAEHRGAFWKGYPCFMGMVLFFSVEPLPPGVMLPSDHLLRRIDQFLDLESVRAELRPFYSKIGRPLSIQN